MPDKNYTCSGSRSTPAEFEDGDSVMNEKGTSWTYIAASDVWVISDASPYGPDPSTSRSWDNLMHHCGPFVKSLPRLDIREP